MSAGSALAARIQTELESSPLREGELVGNQRDLCLRFEVTPAVLRQAMRILEARDVVTMRRGIGGGIFVKETSLDTVANYMATLWEIEGFDHLATMTSTRVVQRLALDMADRNMTAIDIGPLRRLQADCLASKDSIERSRRAMLRENFIASLSRNPVLILTHATAVRYIGNTIPFEYLDLEAQSPPGETDVKVEALIAGDIDAAAAAASSYLRGVVERLHRWDQSGIQTTNMADSFEAASRPVWLSRQIIRVIRSNRLRHGSFLGTESDLIARFGVGRRTWREALKLLEEHPAVESRRGTGGGIYVSDPSAERAGRMVRDWLQQQRPASADLICVEEALFVAHLEPVCDRLRGQGLLVGERSASDAPGATFDALLQRIVALAGCPILRMFGTTCQSSFRTTTPSNAPPDQVEALLRCIADRDLPAAKRIMRRIFWSRTPKGDPAHPLRADDLVL